MLDHIKILFNNYLLKHEQKASSESKVKHTFKGIHKIDNNFEFFYNATNFTSEISQYMGKRVW